MSLWHLVAQSTSTPSPGGGGFDFLLVILLMVVGYYFFIALPQKRDRAERQKMLNALAKGDRVITSAGIHGKVLDISKKGDIEVVTLECSRNVQIDFSRSAITAVLRRKGEGTGTDMEPAEKDEASSKSAKGKG